MTLKGYSCIICCLLAAHLVTAQYSLSGRVTDMATGKAVPKAQVYCKTSGEAAETDAQGQFWLKVANAGRYELVFFTYGYEVRHEIVDVQDNVHLSIALSALSREMNEVMVMGNREEIFGLKRLNHVEGTAIYAGKKTEVVLMDQLVGNLAANNARQVYSQVVGLNIYESNDAGLQLNVGGRGLDPNRTGNFNTRQNSYDISADVLGYPESYYTPPAEALSEIQVVRGAASLQYGTQFGGLINFKMKQPEEDRPIALVSRQSVGSYGLFTSFNSLSGTPGKLSYYTYFNYKKGNGYRPNSGFGSRNFFASLGYQAGSKTRLTVDFTYLHYLAQQAGGLTDSHFQQNPRFSNRTRNWFEVDWMLYALTLSHKPSAMTDLSLMVFGLNASRHALGFRGIPGNLNGNPISVTDETNPDGSFVHPRDLIKGTFRNWGAEARWLTRYKVSGCHAAFLLGTKFYQANNTSRQGPGSPGSGPDFSFHNDEHSAYPNQSNFRFPNLNLALFAENVFYFSPMLSITPGARLEYIKTESDGSYVTVNYDNAGNAINRKESTDNRLFERSFILLGLGLGYDTGPSSELYANFSQNYRSVTFSDIRVVNPTFIIDPGIRDESGFNIDMGLRGKWLGQVSYDMGVFGLVYNDRIGTVLDDRANRVRSNIGKALIYGAELFADWNAARTLGLNTQNHRLAWFLNAAFTYSEYVDSDINNVKGRQLEFVPPVNLKTGLRSGYKNLLGSIQFTYLGQQFTDAENSTIPLPGDSSEGVIGQVPAYHIIDVSLSYTLSKFRIETGINNLLNAGYFTRRATGYPGPGIIPSDGRSFYLTLGIYL